MPKGKRGRRKPDPVEIRFSLFVRKDISATLTEEQYNEVYQRWVETGELPDGFKVSEEASQWRNSARPPSLDNWRTGDNEEAKESLLRRALPATHFKKFEKNGRSANLPGNR